MHTGANLTTKWPCKCEACASDRAEYVNLEALRRYTNEYLSIEDQQIEADELKDRAASMLAAANERQRELHERVRKELAAEAKT